MEGESFTLKVKNGKDCGLRSVSVSSDSIVLVNGPMMQMAVYIDVTSESTTEPSVGRCLWIHTLHRVCWIVGAIIM